MGIFSAGEIASKVFLQEEPLMYVAGSSLFSKSVSKAFDDGDNEILGFIPNPGNTIATVFGIPLGTQFGTAMGMEGWGALAFDIISDPTTWLSVGALFTPAAPAGVAGLGATLAKHGLRASQVGVKMSKVQKAQRFLDGMSVSAKTERMADIFQTAAKAAENPKLVQSIISAAQAGDTAAMFKNIDILKKSGLKNRFYKLSKDPGSVLDITKLESTTGLNKLREAYQVEQQLKRVSNNLVSFGDETVAALRYGFVGPKFLSKGVDILNTLPGIEAIARGTNIVTSTVGAGLNRGAKLTGLSKTKQAVMDTYYKHTAVVGAAKSLDKGIDEIIPRIQFEGNGSIINLTKNGSEIAKEAAGLNRWTDRIYKSELDMVAGMGDAGRFLSDTLARTRTHAEYKAGGLISQLYKVGGRKSGIKNTLEDSITNKLAGKEKERALDAMTILKQDETYDDQVRTLETMLQTDGIPLNEVHRYLDGGDLFDATVGSRSELIKRRLVGSNRARRFANDSRFIPTRETEEAFKIMSRESGLLAKNMEDLKLPTFAVKREMADMSGDVIRKLTPDRTFTALRSETGNVMFSPHTGLVNEKRIDDINLEIARQQAYDELSRDLARGTKTLPDIERRADEIIAGNELAYTVARDEVYRLNKAESHLTLNSSANFSRNELGVVGYAADPLAKGFKSSEFFDKWASYYAGTAQSIQNHASISGISRKVTAAEYTQILTRQGVNNPDEVKRLIAQKLDKDDLVGVTVGEDMVDAIARETGDLKAGAHGRRLISHFLGEHVKKDTLSWQLVTQANKYQIATKLSFIMSALTNLGQTANVLIGSGHLAAFRAAEVSAKELFRGVPGVADEIGTLAHNSVKDLDEGLNAFGGPIDMFLEAIGFSTVERFNRRMSTYAGILTAESIEKSVGVKSSKAGWESFWGRYEKTTEKMAQSYAKPEAIRAQLEKARLPKTAKEADILNRSLPTPTTPDAVRFVAENTTRSVDQIMKEIKDKTFEGFTKGEVKQIATETVNLQQFRTSAIDVAEAFNNPLGSFVGIFMKFQFKQSEFFVREVAKPGLEFIGSRGKKGNITPLLVSLSPIGALAIGEVIMDIKSSLNDRDRPDHLGQRLWEDYLAIGGAGFFSQAIEPIATGTFNPFKAKQLAGANLNDLVKFTNAFGIFLTDGEDDKFWDELMKDITHPLPARLRSIPRGALRGLKDNNDARQTQVEYDRFLDEQAEDRFAEFGP